jgi:opacity protein-like surface antigen
MKKLLIVLACTLLSSAALADGVSLEARFGDVSHSLAQGKVDSTEYDLAVSHDLVGGLTAGVELQDRQAQGTVTGIAAANLGLGFSVIGVSVKPYGEVGRESVESAATNFWGAGVNASYPIVGPLSVEAGYRHRAAFNDTTLMKEDRVSGGLALALTKKDALALSYQHYTGTLVQDVVGVSLRHSF